MKVFYVIVAVVLAILIYLWLRPPGERVSEDITTPLIGEEMISTVGLFEQSDMGQSGQAIITANEDGMAVVTLSMTGGGFTEPQPAHIHSGSCPEPGPVVYPLTDVMGGLSETTLSVSYDELMMAEEAMAINVHKSYDEVSVYTACGDLN
jgi:hypothetical protein